MKSALVLGATVMPNGRMLVRVGCPWCARIHVHGLLRRGADFQPPPCGTPSVYEISVGAERRNGEADRDDSALTDADQIVTQPVTDDTTLQLVDQWH
jgi:hypothetical protein